jgi:hypothetical protein
VPHQTSWYIQDQILFTRLHGDITLEEIEEFSLENSAMIKDSPAPIVNTFFVLEEITDYPKNIVSLARVVNREEFRQPKLGWVVIVGIKNAFLRFLVSSTNQLLGHRLRMFDTQEEATAFLEHIHERTDAPSA